MESGADLARHYYDQVVAPLLLRRWPGLPHAAARLGSGSDVLGLDDERSRVLTARLVGTAMHLGFLLERRWPPYPKWLGTLFAALPRAGAAHGALESALAAPSWQEREAALCDALVVLHEVQGAAGLPTAPHVVQPFYDRPFRGLGPVPELLLDSVQHPQVRALPVGVGSVEQWVDNVAVLTSPERRAAAAGALRTAVLGPWASREERTEPVPEVETGI